MKIILAKHVPPGCEADFFKAVQSPQEPKAPEEKAQDAQSSPPLKWRKIGENSYESNKGPVLLCDGGKFLVFDRCTTKDHTAQLVGSFSDSRTAKDFVRLMR